MTNLTIVIAIITIVKLEHNIALMNEREIREQFSHDLVNKTHFLAGTLEMLMLKQEIDDQTKKIIEQAKEQCYEANKLLNKIRKQK